MNNLTLKPSIGALDDSEVIHVLQGEHCVSEKPRVVLTTLLGSCVAACIRDPLAEVGGMNHFLLPGLADLRRFGEAERHAAHLMELLVNALLAAGASRSRLEAKVFGGANTLGGRTDIGARNSAFALDFLACERISLVGKCLGGASGMRIQYWPVSGRARRNFIADVDVVPTARVFTPTVTNAGSLELF